MCVRQKPSIGQVVVDTLVSEGQNDEQTPDAGASACIPEPWDDITGNKVLKANYIYYVWTDRERQIDRQR